MRQMIDRAGSIEGFFLEGADASADDIGDALRQLLEACARAGSESCVRQGAEAAGRLLFLPATVRRIRVQTLNLFSAMDGAA